MFDRLIPWLRPRKDGGGSSGSLSPPELERALEALEEEAAEAKPGFEGQAFKEAADLCVRAGETERALTYLGRAIDAYLEDEQPEAARAVARRLIRLHPRAIRTLCTITWLDLAGGYLGDALLHLGEYVEASRRGERQEICRNQILEMARIVNDEQFCMSAAEGLQDLGFPDDAVRVRGWAGAAGDAGRRPPGPDSSEPGPEGLKSDRERRLRCFEAAVGANRSEREGEDDRDEGDGSGAND